MIGKIYIILIFNQVFFRLKNVLHNQDLQIDIAVNITAIWKLSHTVGYISKNGNIYSCTKVESNNPEPTSINVSKRFRIIKLRPTRKEIQKREPKNN